MFGLPRLQSSDADPQVRYLSLIKARDRCAEVAHEPGWALSPEFRFALKQLQKDDDD
jgi:hypothetical protein